jgi:hypothetical protein
MENAAQRIADLFAGFGASHGTHGTPYLDENGLKWNIKNVASTVKSPVTLDLWEQHLAGKRPLGVAPVREDDTCIWGSIDVDQYDIDLLDVVKKVEQMKLPLVPCKSKSGGLHLFIFMAEPAAASAVQSALRDIAAALGFAGSEIFPKQTHVDVARGDQASWMIMPYFGSDYGGKIHFQRGLKKTGAEQTLEEFIGFAEKRKVTEDNLSLLRQKKQKKSRVPFSDGPPCLQYLAEGGFPDGGRNNALFQIGVYLKRAFSSDWREMLEQDNQKFMRPPLPSEEVQGVIKSLEKKEYEYKCKDQPMASHCNSGACRGRKYGVGTEGAYPEITGIRKLLTEPAVWFVDVAGKTLYLSTKELQNYQLFHAACMEFADVVFKMLPPATWTGILQEAMAKITHLPADTDIGTANIFLEHLEAFLTNRNRGDAMEDLLRGAPWENEDEERHYFRLKDFQKFLERENFKMGREEITRRIQNLGGGKHFEHIKGHGTNMRWVPSRVIVPAPKLEPPKPPKEEI